METKDILVLPSPEAVPEIYANGYKIASGLTDVIIILERNGRDIYSINLSFTAAKSMAQGLTEVIQSLEARTGINIKTVAEISKSLAGEPDETDS